MASKKSNFLARFARGAALSAAIGAGKPANATSIEQSQASEMYRNQNSARNDARRSTGTHTDDTAGLELDDIRTSIEPGSEGNPSLQATPDGRDGIKLKLKFDVPLKQSNRDRVNEIIQKSHQKRNRQHTPTNSPTSDTEDSSEPTSDTPEDMDQGVDATQAQQQQMADQTGNSPSNKGEGIEENPFPIADAESNPSSEQGATESNEETEEEQSKFLDRALAEEQIREQQLELERGKKKQEVQKKRNLGMRILQQTQAQEMSMKQDQQLAQKLARTQRIIQTLDKKIQNLEHEKFPLTLQLRALQILKLFIIIMRIFVLLLALVFFITIILFLIGSALMTFNRFLGGLQRGLNKKIDGLKKQIKEIDEKINKAKEDRKKAINVIQLIQRQKRVGRRPKAPKFDVPQAA